MTQPRARINVSCSRADHKGAGEPQKRDSEGDSEGQRRTAKDSEGQRRTAKGGSQTRVPRGLVRFTNRKEMHSIDYCNYGNAPLFK